MNYKKIQNIFLVLVLTTLATQAFSKGRMLSAGTELTLTPEQDQCLKSAQPLGPSILIDIDFKNPQSESNPENVRRVFRIIGTEEDYDKMFCMRKKGFYTYENFMNAVARYPQFCNEKDESNTNSLDDVCKIELATFLANATQETGGHSPWDDKNDCKFHRQSFALVNEQGCTNAAGNCTGYNAKCSDAYWGKVYPCSANEWYFGRGPFQLSWNYNYGAFGLVMDGDIEKYLKNPDAITNDGGLAFLSAFWFYMTPSSPKPSIHEVAVGFFKPNSSDKATNNVAGFGTTINIINGGIECGSGLETQQAQNRREYLQAWMKDFGLENNDYATNNVTCINIKAFSADGWANERKIYWSKSGSKCALGNDNTSVYPIWVKNGESMCNNA